MGLVAIRCLAIFAYSPGCQFNNLVGNIIEPAGARACMDDGRSVLAAKPQKQVADDLNGLGARSRVAKSAQEFIVANFRTPVQLEDLCRESGTGIRTLQRCFRGYFDLSITDYLKTVRLDSAYRELTVANGEGENVTKIALRNGFTHLGRFSVAYHVRFGEMPSETLAARPIG